MKRRSLLPVLLAIIACLMGGAESYLAFMDRAAVAQEVEKSGDQVGQGTTIEASEAVPPKEITIGKDSALMMLIPAGEFQMGSYNYWNEKKKASHTIYLDAFYIDKYEVTNALYMKFVEDTGHKAPEYWDIPGFDSPDQPVVGITWEDARTYCNWAGKRLPTEAQWEKSALGGLVEKRYPWGNELARANYYCNYSSTGENDKWDYTAPVGSFPGNGYGLYDMEGNAAEWCADWYNEDYDAYYPGKPERNPKGPRSGQNRVVRGTSWFGIPSRRDGFYPTRAYITVGFRCAQDVKIALTLQRGRSQRRVKFEGLPAFGVVKGSSVRLREQPSLEEETIGFVGVDQARKYDWGIESYGGELVIVLERSEYQTEIDGHEDHWYKIRTISEDEWLFNKEGWCYGKFLTIHHHERKQPWTLYHIRTVNSYAIVIDFGLGAVDQSPRDITVVGTEGSLFASLDRLILSPGFLDSLFSYARPDDLSFARKAGVGIEVHPLGIYHVRDREEAKDIGKPLFAIAGRHLPMDFTTVHEQKISEYKAQLGPFLRVYFVYCDGGDEFVLFDNERRQILKSNTDGYDTPFIKVPLSFQMEGKKCYVVQYAIKGSDYILTGVMWKEGDKWQIAVAHRGYPHLL
jgi:sulfatase modifying factor 1